MTLGRDDGIPVAAEDGVAPGGRDTEDVAMMVWGSHMDVAVSVPVGKTEAGEPEVVPEVDAVAVTELTPEVAPIVVLNAPGPLTGAVPLIAEDVIDAVKDPTTFPVVKDA
jgi:hypothetical protein